MHSKFNRLFSLALASVVSGCGANVKLPTDHGSAFNPIAFFIGRTRGDGELKKLFSRSIEVRVDSVGRKQGDMLVLDQTIREPGKPASTRRWRLRFIDAVHYTGSLTDAVGPVQITVKGSGAEITYTMKGDFLVRQQLAVQEDGRTMLNRLEVRKFGLRVASLNETIRKLN